MPEISKKMMKSMELIIRAGKDLLSICDGAHTKDFQGFNKPDSLRVRKLFRKGLINHPFYVSELASRLVKYQNQLTGFGYNIDDLEFEWDSEYIKPHESAYDYEINFGKHIGETWGKLADTDPNYLCWLSQNIQNPKVRKIARYTLWGNDLSDIFAPREKIKVDFKVTENEIGIHANKYYKPLIERIKALYTRRYDSTTYTWFVPLVDVERVKNALSQVKGIEYEFPDIEVPPIQIVLDGAIGTINNADKEILRLVSDKLRFKSLATDFSKKFERGDWDGYIRLFDWRTNQFLIGYRDDVIEVLKSNDRKYEIVDHREEPGRRKFKWLFPHEVRSYQEKIVDKMLTKDHFTLFAPTGAGKTLMFLYYAWKSGLDFIAIVPSKTLLYQWVDVIHNVLGIPYEDIGMIGDKGKRPKKYPIRNKNYEGIVTVMSYQSYKGYKPLKKNYGICVVDESHKIAADSIYNMVSEIPSKYRVSMSATHMRDDGKEMKLYGHSGRVVDVGFNIFRAIKDEGAIADPDFIVERGGFVTKKIIKQVIDDMEVNHNKRQLKKNEKDPNHIIERFNKRTVKVSVPLLKNYMIKGKYRNKKIIKCVKHALKDGYKPLVELERPSHGRIIKELLENENIRVVETYGETDQDDREERYKIFTENDNVVIVSTVLKLGVDIPVMSAIILADLSKGLVKNIQAIGRALRKKDGENRARIYMIKDEGIIVGKWYELKKTGFLEYYGDFLYEDFEYPTERGYHKGSFLRFYYIDEKGELLLSKGLEYKSYVKKTKDVDPYADRYYTPDGFVS
jgi:superfamily II DNA or RNA helicase